MPVAAIECSCQAISAPHAKQGVIVRPRHDPEESEQKNRRLRIYQPYGCSQCIARLVGLHTATMKHKKQAEMLALLTIGLALALPAIHSLGITNGHCQKNISVKYQVPVTKGRLVPSSSSNATDPLLREEQQYIVYEERVRWDTVQVCCPGYRTIIFGFCEPICLEACPAHSFCLEPNKCRCMRGYEHSHHPNKQHQLICRPICQGGCPEHSHCIAHNECECRPGFRDTSSWFSLSLSCERIQCGQEQRYDVTRRACVKIEMSMEELMQRVAERLAKGLESDTETTTEEQLN